MIAAAAAVAAAKSLQLCLTLCNPIDVSPPGSPVPGILQARTLEWVVISFSNAWKWKVKSESEVAQSCPTFQDPMDCSFPGSSVHGIFQARVLEWGAIAFFMPLILRGFPGDSAVKSLLANAGEPSWVPGWGRSAGERNGYPLQYSCLENSMDRGAWRAIPHGVKRVGQDWASNTHSLCTNTVPGIWWTLIKWKILLLLVLILICISNMFSLYDYVCENVIYYIKLEYLWY